MTIIGLFIIAWQAIKAGNDPAMEGPKEGYSLRWAIGQSFKSKLSFGELLSLGEPTWVFGYYFEVSSSLNALIVWCGPYARPC